MKWAAEWKKWLNVKFPFIERFCIMNRAINQNYRNEPTTELHAADIEKVVSILETFVDRGNTVIVIEHNTDVMKLADYIIDIHALFPVVHLKHDWYTSCPNGI